MPFSVTELELTEPMPPCDAGQHSHVLALARWHGRPIGWVWADAVEGRVEPWAMAQAVQQQVGWETVIPVLGEGGAYPASTPAPPISVVVCTRNRAESLAVCLQSLAELDYPDFEIVVIDNAPADDSTSATVSRFPARYVREDRPGLDWARNRGIAEASHAIIAFTDDDVRVDRRWLRGVAEGFANPGVMAVTGLVAPMELESQAQVLFEHVYGGMGKGMKGRTFHRTTMRPAAMIAIHRLGVGANMAYRREVFEQIGDFDTALDVGTPSNGGGDLDMFHRVIAAGLGLWYEPRALVWHRHRADLAGLRTQLYNDGRSFTVYLMKLWRTRSVPRISLVRYATWVWSRWLVGRVVLGLAKKHRLPLPLLWAGLSGALSGPRAYIATRRNDHRIRTSFGKTG